MSAARAEDDVADIKNELENAALMTAANVETMGCLNMTSLFLFGGLAVATVDRNFGVAMWQSANGLRDDRG